MMLGVGFGCLGRMMGRVVKMALRCVSVMCGFLMISRFMMSCCLTVVMRGLFVMVGCVAVMLCCLL